MDNIQLPAYPQACCDDGSKSNALPGLTKMEAFTMAAMRGLCSGLNASELTPNYIEQIGYSAADIAERTLRRLTELSKQQ